MPIDLVIAKPRIIPDLSNAGRYLLLHPCNDAVLGYASSRGEAERAAAALSILVDQLKRWPDDPIDGTYLVYTEEALLSDHPRYPDGPVKRLKLKCSIVKGPEDYEAYAGRILWYVVTVGLASTRELLLACGVEGLVPVPGQQIDPRRLLGKRILVDARREGPWICLTKARRPLTENGLYR